MLQVTDYIVIHRMSEAIIKGTGVCFSVLAGLFFFYKPEVETFLKGVYNGTSNCIEFDTVRASLAVHAITRYIQDNADRVYFTTGTILASDGHSVLGFHVGHGLYVLRDATFGVLLISYQDDRTWVTTPFNRNEKLKEFVNTVCNIKSEPCLVFTFHTEVDGRIDWNETTFRNPRDITVDQNNQPFIDDYDHFIDEDAPNPYRRGYVLHGPPGTGKSSAIEYVANKHGSAIFMVILNMIGMDDSVLIQLLASVPERSIILFEDLDVQMENLGQIKKNRLSQSGLWNAVDSACRMSAGTIVIATCNDLDLLKNVCGDAFFRLGRIDVLFPFVKNIYQ